MDLEIWVVFPDTRRAATAEVRDELRRECRRRSWPMQEKMSRLRRFDGRPRQLVSGADSVNLYRRAHRVRVAVFVAGKPFVPLNPDPLGTKHTLPLTRFVRYKAHARRLPTEKTDVSTQLDSCDAWCRIPECEGGHDPRCLPFPVFDTEHADLDERQQRQVFDDHHGPGARRVDDRGLTWSLDSKAFHGREELHVAGCKLPRGFHWDVSVSDGPKMLMTGTDLWRVFRYVNISPDANVRGRNPYAQKIRRNV